MQHLPSVLQSHIRRHAPRLLDIHLTRWARASGRPCPRGPARTALFEAHPCEAGAPSGHGAGRLRASPGCADRPAVVASAGQPVPPLVPRPARGSGDPERQVPAAIRGSADAALPSVRRTVALCAPPRGSEPWCPAPPIGERVPAGSAPTSTPEPPGVAPLAQTLGRSR